LRERERHDAERRGLALPVPLRPGDRIALGDSEVIFEATDSSSQSQLIALDSDSHAKSLVILMHGIDDTQRTGVLASLAMQFIDDRSMADVSSSSSTAWSS
jgi:hypothetical protein